MIFSMTGFGSARAEAADATPDTRVPPSPSSVQPRYSANSFIVRVMIDVPSLMFRSCV